MNVAIIDYGSGNLRSATKAFERALFELGSGKVNLTNNPKSLKDCSHIVLPGVGAFSECMARLSALDGMVESLDEHVIHKGKPFLGICVGMQLMANIGREYTVTNGLGWIPGEVVAIFPDDATLKIPHMGWNDLHINNSKHPAMLDLSQGDHTYFVHSYQFLAKEPNNIIATVDYGGPLTAIIARDNLIGTQFHPEKSQQTGLIFIKNFLGWHP